jgi:hypothetical protein
LKEYWAIYGVNNSLSNVDSLMYKGTPGGDNFGEATLDVQVITGVGRSCHTTVANTNNTRSTEESYGFGYAFLDFLVKLNAVTTSANELPHVVSLSLGSLSFGSCNLLCAQAVKRSNDSVSKEQCEAFMKTQRQVCMYDGERQSNRISVELMKLGARGVTVVVASGDGGSHYSFQPFTGGNNPSLAATLNAVSCDYNLPTFPCASPYVTCVGGAQYDSLSTPEYWPAGGGGFSWQFETPDYQKAAVAAYLASGDPALPPSASFNGKGRAYPEVVAFANNVPIVMNGIPVPVGGTSAAAPAFGGFVSLLNDVRLRKKLPPLGFLNPRLYAAAAGAAGSELFKDIKSGNTKGNSSGSSCATGFPATAGWDPATGFGAPVWAGWLKCFGDDNGACK